MTGFRAFSFEFAKTFPVLSTGFEIETEMTIHAVNNHMQIENYIIEFRDRPEGSESKLNTYSDGMRVLMTIARLYRDYKPMGFFSILSLLLAVISAAFFIPIFIEYINTGLVLRFPTLIMCGFVMLAAILSLFAGLILHNMTKNHRRQFEMRLISLHAEKNKMMIHRKDNN